MAAVGSAAMLWIASLVRQAVVGATDAGALGLRAIGQAWALTIGLAAFTMAGLGLTLISALAASRHRRLAWEYQLAVMALAVAVAELLRRPRVPVVDVHRLPTPRSAGNPAGVVAAAGSHHPGLRIQTTSVQAIPGHRTRPAPGVPRKALGAPGCAGRGARCHGRRALIRRADRFGAAILRNLLVLLAEQGDGLLSG